MLKWIADWWRFLLISAAIGAIAAVAKRFLDGWIADSVVTFISLIGGANMIFDLIGRRSWEQRLAEKEQEKEQEISIRNQLLMDRDLKIAAQERQIATQERQIAAQEREIASLDHKILTQDRELTAQGQEISDLRQRLDELERKFNGQSQTESQE